jgi:S-DNA-T family DNA segregation ATPase FtsK/SpoIIIE
VYVSTVKPGVVELRLVGFDVLRNVRMPRKATAELLKVPVALREDATPFVRDYRTIPHQLTLGATLSGKSMYLRHLVTGLARQPVALVGIDCKRGVELAPFASRLSALATDPDEAAELLPVLVKEMEDRYDLIKARQGIAPSTPDEEITSDIWGLPDGERPVPIVLFVDEVAELFLVATKKDEERRDEMVTQLIRLAQLGRAAGIYLEVCGQRFGAELGKGATMLRAQLTGRVCHRVNDEASAKMALGDIAPEAVFAACAIAPELPGLAVAGDTSGGWSRIRTPYLSLGAAAETCRDTAHVVPDLPALKSFRPDVPVWPVESAAPAGQPRPVAD